MSHLNNQHAQTPVQFHAEDGRLLSGRLFLPQARNGHSVLISCAMGVKHGYYHAFAAFLAEAGCVVLCYDYRGIGESSAGAIRAEDATMWQWGQQDLTAAIAYMHRHYPEQKLVVVGHSLGGQLLGLASNNHLVSGLLAITTPSGYWRHWSGPSRYLLGLLWHVGMPSLTNLCGYFPSKRLRLGRADLPLKVAHEWARWCRHSGYVVDEQGQPWRSGFEGFKGRLLAYRADDDWMAPEASVRALIDCYTHAEVRHQLLVAKTVAPAGKLGHFGYFKAENKGLWPAALAWLTGGDE